jgi:hypothetical protein
MNRMPRVLVFAICIAVLATGCLESSSVGLVSDWTLGGLVIRQRTGDSQAEADTGIFGVAIFSGRAALEQQRVTVNGTRILDLTQSLPAADSFVVSARVNGTTATQSFDFPARVTIDAQFAGTSQRLAALAIPVTLDPPLADGTLVRVDLEFQGVSPSRGVQLADLPVENGLVQVGAELSVFAFDDFPPGPCVVRVTLAIPFAAAGLELGGVTLESFDEAAIVVASDK